MLQWAATAESNTALILTALGALAVTVEFLRPGSILPGVTGSVLAFLGLYSLARIPSSPLAWILILGGLAGVSLEIAAWFRIVFGACVLAGLMMIPRVTLLPAVFTAAVLALICGVLLPLARRARRNKTEEATNVTRFPVS